MSEAEGHRAFVWITDEYSVPLLRSDIVALLRDHRERGDQVVLLSGTFEPLLQLIGARVGALSVAYADSIYDLPVLEMVGRPVAVYPDEELAAVALERGWTVVPERTF